MDQKREKQEQYQLVGQLCEAAVYLYFDFAFDEYDAKRQLINKTPYRGDGSYDWIDHYDRKVNSKGSLARNPRMDFRDYNLYVRSSERKADRYILCVIHPSNWQLVHIVGWWPDYGFNGDEKLKFGDRHEVSGHLLYPMLMYWEFR